MTRSIHTAVAKKLAGLLVEALAPYLVLPMGERTSFVGLLEVFLVGVVAFFLAGAMVASRVEKMLCLLEFSNL